MNSRDAFLFLQDNSTSQMIEYQIFEKIEVVIYK